MDKPLLPPKVQEALDKGRLIDAIKLLRQSSPIGLKEAKDLIEAHVRKAAAAATAAAPVKPAGPKPADGKFEAIKTIQAQSGLSPGEVPRRGYIDLIVLVVALIAAGYYFT